MIQSGAVVGMGAVGLLMGRRAGAADLPHLTSADAAAKPLHYTEDAGKMDRASNPAYVPGSKCANCGFFRGNPRLGLVLSSQGRRSTRTVGARLMHSRMMPGEP